MRRVNTIFRDVPWRDVRDKRNKDLAREIAEYDPDELLNTSIEDLSRYFEDKYKIEVPELLEDQKVAAQRETPIDVSQDWSREIPDRSRPYYISGTLIEVTVPFKGEAWVWGIGSTIIATRQQNVEVKDDHLVIGVKGLNLDHDKVRSEIEGTISSVKRSLDTLAKNVTPFNDRLYESAKQAIEKRREKLLNDQDLVTSLGYPLKKRKNAPRTYVAPEVRRKIRTKPPAASTEPFVPEPALSDGDYDHILNVVQNMAQVMERSPSAFKDADEEALRTHFLVQLNGHYEGAATGETFNYNGKTDILIRVKGKNIFIAECKFWGGPKRLTETIDQILHYSAWRDTKTAIILFSKNKNFSSVLESIQPTVQEHPHCKRFLETRSETITRYLLSHKDDPNRELTLTVLAFNVPNQEEETEPSE